MASLGAIKVEQGTRPVKVTLDGRQWSGLWHMFYESNGEPMALVETYCGAVTPVPAPAISFQDLDWHLRAELPSEAW